MHVRTGNFKNVATILFAGLLFGELSNAATVTASTVTAWENYVSQSKARLAEQADGPEGFFGSQFQSRSVRAVNSSEPIDLLSVTGKMIPVPSGLVHHWIGDVFVPNVSARDVLAVMQDYDGYADVYKPAVSDSKLLRHDVNEFGYRIKFIQQGFGVKAGLLGEFRTSYTRLSPTSGYSVTEALQLTELQNPGTAGERALTFSEARGYVERTFTIARYLESDHGVLIEIESLTLSRGVPASVRWLVAPAIQRFSRQTMTATLERLRDKLETTTQVQSASRK